MRSSLVIIGWLMLAACVSTRRAAFVLKSRGQLASICAQEYPVKDSLIFLPGRLDTIYIPFSDTLVWDTCISRIAERIPEIKVIRGKPYVVTIRRIDTVKAYLTNTAEVAAVRDSLSHTKSQLALVSQHLDVWRRLALIFGGILLVLIFLKYLI